MSHEPNAREERLGIVLVVWSFVWAFWLLLTRRSHPSWAHALVATTSLIVAYAIAAYLNHAVLIPRYWRTSLRRQYTARLVVMMTMLTGLALAIVRTAYVAWTGPDADPIGVYKHFAIDFVGMAVHLLGAAGVTAMLAASPMARQIASVGMIAMAALVCFLCVLLLLAGHLVFALPFGIFGGGALTASLAWRRQVRDTPSAPAAT